MGKISTLRWHAQYSESSSRNKEDLACAFPSGRVLVAAIEGALSRNPKESAYRIESEIYYRVFRPETDPQVCVEIVYDLSDFPKVNISHLRWRIE